MTRSRPGIWGKLPAFGDFVRLGVTTREVEDWRAWFDRHPVERLGSTGRAWPLPWSFVLSPGVLPFSGSRYVVGAVADSSDKVGRRHPLLIYRTVPRRWLLERPGRPDDVLFLLARLLASHQTARASSEDGAAGVDALDAQLERVWRAERPAWLGRFGLRREAGGLGALREALVDSVGAVDAVDAVDAANDKAAPSVRGVPHPPWAGWPQCLLQGRYAWFWQQDGQGGYVDHRRIAGPAG